LLKREGRKVSEKEPEYLRKEEKRTKEQEKSEEEMSD
jgi:hypothetical protein